MSTSLIQISEARRSLAMASTLEDVMAIRDKATAIRTYLSAIGESLLTQNQAAEIKLRAERKAGELLSGMTKAKNQHTAGDTMSPAKLSDLGIHKKQASRWQAEAKVAEDEFEQWVKKSNEAGEEITQSALLKLSRGCHVSKNSEDNEWYTPPQFIAAARKAMGSIDLDPASCKAANGVVCAKRFFDIKADGLKKAWWGNVWLNPPYSKTLIPQFADKVIAETGGGRVPQLVMLVNNATETDWFQRLLQCAAAVCFPKSRIKFLNEDMEPEQSPLQGQAFLYFGDKSRQFVGEFSQFGACLQSP